MRRNTMTGTTLEEQRAKLLGYEKGFSAVYLLKMGTDLGLFKKLNTYENGVSPSGLASELGLHEPYVRVWCQTAYHMEVLDCDKDGRFRLAPHMGALLAETENPYYFGAVVNMRVRYSSEHLKRYAKYFRSGDTYSREADGPGFSTALEAITGNSIPAAYMFMIIPSIPGLTDRLDAGMRILEVGCGSGLLMIHLAKAFPSCKFVGVEVDRFAVEAAKRHIRENGVEDRVSALLVDATSTDYDREFDLVNMALVLHEIERDMKHRAIANCHRALNDPGEIVILDLAYPDRLQDFRKPEYTMSITDQFFELTWGSELLPLAAKKELLLELGFKDPVNISLLGGSLEVTHAKK
jgi:SAM-dependent methyltransferase